MSSRLTEKKGAALATIAGLLALASFALPTCSKDSERPQVVGNDPDRQGDAPQRTLQAVALPEELSLSSSPSPSRQELTLEAERISTPAASLNIDQFVLKFVRPDKSPVLGSSVCLYLCKPGLQLDYRHVDELALRESRNPHFEYPLPDGAEPGDYLLHASYRADTVGNVSFILPELQEPFDWAIYVINSSCHVPFFICSSENRLQPATLGINGELQPTEIEVPDPTIKYRFFSTQRFHTAYTASDSGPLRDFSIEITDTRYASRTSLWYDPKARAFDFRGEAGSYSAHYRTLGPLSVSTTSTFSVGIEGEHRYLAFWATAFREDIPSPQRKESSR